MSVISFTGDPLPDRLFGGGGDNGSMEPRIRALEDAVLKINTQLLSIATKEDVAKLDASIEGKLHAMTWKLIGACGFLAAAVYFIATHTGP